MEQLESFINGAPKILYADLPVLKEENYSFGRFSVALPQFEGYFEALLDLIEKETVNISEISLTDVTAQYLEYFSSQNIAATKFGLSNASEFLVICACLLELKSKRILPREESEETEELELSLVDHVAQYKIFKLAAVTLKERKELFSKIYHRSKLEEEFVYEKKYYLKDVSAFDLVQAFRKVLKDVEHRGQSIEIVDEIITVEEKIFEIKNKIAAAKEGMIFESLFSLNSRIEVIVTFLALLELIRQKCVIIKQIEVFGSILLFPVNIAEAKRNEDHGRAD